MRTGLYLGEVPIGKVVVAVAGEGGIQLQEKIITPSKGDPIEVIPDIGIDGLSKVTIEPIPDAYIDTTTDNAPYAGDMLKGTIAFANTKKIEGELEDKDILEYSADGLSFKDGDLIVSGTNTERAIIKAEADVSITVEGTDLGNATAADVLNGKTFTSENGLVIEGTGPTLANLNATSSNVLAGKKFIGPNGIEETGTMANLGNVSATLNSTTKSKEIREGYTPGGIISLGTNVVDTTISSNEAQAAHILSGKKAYANGSLITGDIATKTSSDLTSSGATVYAPAGYYASQASKSISSGTLSTPSISVSSSGVITATSGISTEGYLSTSASKSNKKSLTTQSGKTVTPSTSTQTAVSSNRYTTGTVYVAGDSNLVSSNIKSGVSIFGVNGSYSGGGTPIADETCTIVYDSNADIYCAYIDLTEFYNQCPDRGPISVVIFTTNEYMEDSYADGIISFAGASITGTDGSYITQSLGLGEGSVVHASNNHAINIVTYNGTPALKVVATRARPYLAFHPNADYLAVLYG